ncbi:tetratricopeptide (TPR) repeat protein [Saccharothrix coeruleofusca]|uniref:hypothetical protein n=1 Tax=Saccharothrix coeruleofusca TaxID=33919 RepID=UPI001FD28EB4|nr:hypothetical protein [Saccharothrix coeruleofusca]MBP2335361.1 tetratricopeptide (TPR) repeat protein [Saccharothrix coeruleofusca]
MSDVPERVGFEDVARIEEGTAVLRQEDYRAGGGACRDAAVASAQWHDRLLDARATHAVRVRLLVALADAHNLAAWTCFDTGVNQAAGRHWARALELATEAGHDDLAANIHYRTGRLHLHRGACDDALLEFDRGAAVAVSAHSKAILHVNQAWAHAAVGNVRPALECLRRAHDQFDRASEVADWARFFDGTDLTAMTGVVHTELARTVDRAHSATAIRLLTAAAAGYGPNMARSRALSLIALTTNHLLAHDFDEAASVCEEALEASRGIGSTRLADRLAPVRGLAMLHRENADAAGVAARVDAFVRD